MQPVDRMGRIHCVLISAVICLCLQIVVINGQAGSIGFYLNGTNYTNGSTVLRTDIGIDEAALQCTTDSTTCCSNDLPEVRGGEFYFPDEGGLVPIRIASFSLGYYRTRDSQLIRLNRWLNGTTTGKFRCEIPESSGRNISLFINIVDITVSITQYGNNTAGASFNLECSATVNGSNDQIDITWLSTFDSEVPFEIVNTTDNSSTLTFNPLFTSHAGTYTCRVRLGGIEKRRYFTLVVEAGVSLSLNGTSLPNNSYVDVENIGAGGPDGRNDVEGLLCLTNKEDCCALAQVGNGTLGQWIFPNGSTVGSRSSNVDLGRSNYYYRNRFRSVVRLLRVGQPNERGSFRCEVPNANNINQTLYVNIVNVTPTPTSTTCLPTATIGSMPNATSSIFITASITSPSPTPSIFITISITSSGSNTAGETFVLKCSTVSSGSNDQPTITWLDSTSQDITGTVGNDRIGVSGITMDPSGSYSNSLSFSPLVVSDAGLFTCKVIIGGVTKVETTTITVNNSTLQISDGGVTPVIGQRYNLTCNIVGSISFDYTYNWRKDGAILINESGSTLVFSQLRLFDAGQYTCEVVGTVSIISNPLNLSLQVPTPEVVITGNSITPYNGTVFNLTGAIQMDMRIVNITATWEWSFGETMLMYQETITPPHESIFKFQPLASNSSGNYILRVTLTPLDNFLFVIENSITVVYNLSVLPLPPRPPSISVISRQSFPDDFCGEIMTLSCTTNPVEGLFTPPVITWIDPEGSEVPTGGNHDPSVESQTSYLVFSEVAANNIGLYKCRTVITIPEALIDNHFDESTISVTTSFPGQVKNLSCVSSSSPNQLSFTWKQPTFQGSEILDYRVKVKQLKHRNGSREVTESNIQDNTTKSEAYIGDGLDPQVPYNITVMARNPGGCGEEKQIYCFTQEGEPPPPRNVTVVRFNSTAVGVSWFKFTLVELKGLAQYFIAYDIIISSRKRVIGGTISVPWTDNRIIISNLQPGAQYRILVQTLTSAGMSLPVEVLTDKAQGNAPNASPSNSSTIIAIVSGIVAVIVVLAVAAVVIAALKFALKLHRRKAFNLQNRSFDSPFMMTNEFYETGGNRLIRIDTVDHNYETVDKYNASYVDPKVPRPYEEIALKFPHSLPQSEQHHSSGAFAQCPLYASATSESDEKQSAETSFSRGANGSDNVGLVIKNEERYVINELQDSGTDPAYATVR